jgi:cytochrome c peroxidase
MKLKLFSSGLILIVVFGLVSFSNYYFTPIYLDIPKDWPQPKYDFSKNQLTEEGFQLGRNLFYDPVLSKDGTISCASCHLQQTGFTHVDHDLSHGIDGKIGTRNSMTLMNLAWSDSFMWDGGVNHLDVQPLHPITSEVEMDETLENVVFKLQKTENYPKLFKATFGTEKITGQLTLKAISQFVVMLTTSNSKYDKVIRNEEKFTEMEKKGYDLFLQNCASCHKEPLFTDGSFKNNGLEMDSTLMDLGRMRITQKVSDKQKFKVPTLRNVQFTFPYMHDGRFKTINDVLKHYNSGIEKSATLSVELQKPMQLSDNERTEIIAFLKTLTDKEFLFNPRFSYPKENN